MESRANPAIPGEGSTLSTALSFDLSAGARHLTRARALPTGIGVGFGSVFVGIGAYEVSLLAGAPFGADTLVAALLIALGLGLVVLSARSGLLNPVRSLRADSDGLRWVRRWGREVAYSWTDPAFRLEVEDLAPDPASTPEQQSRLFFSGSGGVYGSLTPAMMGPLLDAARAHGLHIRIWDDTFRSGRDQHPLRRIRLRGGRPK